MSNVAIQVEGLSKEYTIGARKRSYETLYDVFTRGLKAPLHWIQGKQSSKPAPDRVWALKDVSFEVKEGEIVGVIGRNGAGKSTLLKILSRITDPTRGRAKLRGRVASLLEVGTGFHRELTGRENVYLNGTILGMKRREIERKFDEIVSFAEIEKFIDTPVKFYSSGMYVRLAFAVAVHLYPEILLVDEVLSVGDTAFQRKCVGKMEEVARQGRTALFVSHNMTAIRSLCTRALLLSEGESQFLGKVGECVDHYLLTASRDLPSAVATADLSRPQNIGQVTDLRITAVKLDSDVSNAVLHTEDPLELTIEFQLFRPLTDIVLGWSVHSSEGFRLFECRSTDAYGPLSNLEPGFYSVRTALSKNPLTSGLYSLHVGARSTNKSLDYLPSVMSFQVDAKEQFKSLWLEAPKGVVRIISQWESPRLLQGRKFPAASQR